MAPPRDPALRGRLRAPLDTLWRSLSALCNSPRAGIIATLARLQLTRTKRIEELVAQRTAELEEQVRVRTTISRQLLRGQEMLAAAQAIAHVGSWHWDIREDEVISSDEVYRILDVRPDQLSGRPSDLVVHVHPDDRDELQLAFERALSGVEDLDIDHRVTRSDGSLRWVNLSATVTRNEDGQPQSVLGTVHDITDRLEAERQLREREAELRATLDATSVGISFVSPNREIRYRNRTLVDLVRGESEQPDNSLTVPGSHMLDQAIIAEVWRRIEAGEHTIQLGYQQLGTEDGRTVDVDLTINSVVVDDEVVGHVVTLRDATIERSAQRAFEESETQLRAVLDSTRMGISLVGPEREVLYRNRAFADILGYTQEELGDRPFRELTTRRSVAAGAAGFDALDRKEMSKAAGPLRATHKDGHLIDIDVHLVPLEVDGRQVGYVMDMRDISSELAAKRAIEESESRFRNIFESGASGMMLIDTDGKMQTVNPALCEIFGLDYAVARTGDIHKLFAPEDMPLIQSRFDARLRGESVDRDIQLTITRQNDGTQRQVTVRTRPFVVDGGIEGLISEVRDVTELRESRRALERSRELLEEAQRIAHVGHWEWDIVANEMNWSDETYRIFGLDPAAEAASYPTFLERTHPDDRPAADEALGRALSGEGDYNATLRIVRPDGTVRVVHESGLITWSDDGHPLRVLGVVHDITKRAEAEQALEQNNVYLNTVVNTMQGALLISDENENIILANRAAEQMLGYPMDELTQLKPVAFVHPDERQWLLERNRSRQRGNSIDSTYRRRVVRNDGSSIWVEASPSTLYMNGEVAGRVSEYRDISAQVEAEGQLRDSAARLELAQSMAHVGSWSRDVANGERYWSDEFYHLLGHDPAEDLPSRASYQEHIHPDDRERYLAELRDFREEVSDTYDAQARFVGADGLIRVLQMHGERTRDEHGNPLREDGTGQDVTELVHAQAALAESTARLELAQSMARVGGWGRYLDSDDGYWSDQMYRLLGYEPGAALLPLHHFMEHLHDEDRERFKLEHRAFRDEVVDTYDIQARFVGANGVTRVLRMHGERTRDADGNPLSLEGTAQDVTAEVEVERQLKDAQQRLQENNDYLHTVFDTVQASLMITDPDEHIVLANAAAEEMLGYSMEELADIIPADLVHPDDIAAARKRWEDRRNGIPVPPVNRRRMIRKDGSVVWVDVTSATMNDGDAAKGRVAEYRDVTTQIEAETQLESARERLAEELERAGEVQRAFQPGANARFQMLSVAGLCLPAREVGGDFFDWAPFDGGGVRVTVGDVMGKGIPAAIFMSMTQTAIRASGRPDAHTGSGPASQLSRVNRALFPYLDAAASFVTAFTAEVDRDGRISYADAGHGHALIRHQDASFVDLRSAGLPIGVSASANYTSATAQLRPGDTLLLMTDGLRELVEEAANGRPWTDLIDSAVDAWDDPQQTADEIVALAQSAAPEDGPADDLTIVVLSYEGAAASPDASETPIRSLELTVPPTLGALAAAEADLQLFLRRLHVGDPRSGALLTAVHEILANIIEHAAPTSDVDLTIEVSEDGILVSSCDDGRPFDSDEATRSARSATDRGRGLTMCRILMDRTDYARISNQNQWQLEMKTTPAPTTTMS